MGESKMADCAVSIMVGSTISVAAVWSNPGSPVAASTGMRYSTLPILVRKLQESSSRTWDQESPRCFPTMIFSKHPQTIVCVEKIFHECNYLQANEGNIDPVHLSFLHRFLENRDEQYRGVRGADESHYNLVSRKIAPTIDVELVDFGVRIYTVRRMSADQILSQSLLFYSSQLERVSGANRGRRVFS